MYHPWSYLTDGDLYDDDELGSKVYVWNQTGSWRMESNAGRWRWTSTEMRMLRGIPRVSIRDHMWNEEIRRKLHLSPIDEVMRSGRLRWFEHVQRRDANNVTRRVMELALSGTRRRGRPRDDIVPTDEGRHDERGCYPGCGPRPEGVEKKDKADP